MVVGERNGTWQTLRFRKRSHRALACFVAGVVAAHAGDADGLPLTVSTQSGSVRGAGAQIVAFKGIPYAAPPTGDRRWRPPAPPASWSSVGDATQFGPPCPQPPSGPIPVQGATTENIGNI
jgi:hypothetical protein